MGLKFRNVTIAAILLALVITLGSLLIFLLFTSFIWVPILILLSPSLGLGVAVCKYTRVGDWVNELYLKAYDYSFYKSENARRFLWQQFYDFICWLYPQVQWKFMNYGYAVLNDNGKLINDLHVEDEDERYPLQLYHHIATGLGTLKNLDKMTLLEVGSGRGGGLNYVSRQLKPAKCIGVDVSQNQIDFCRGAYAKNDKIFFYLGDSENLNKNDALTDQQFDMVLNIESSHCYGNFKKFVEGVETVLKPDGLFCIADFRVATEVKQWESDLQSGSLKIVKSEDITINVLHALKLDEKRRLDLINTSVHSWLRPLFKKFSGLNGSRINESMEKRETLYKAYVLKKPAV